MVQGAPRGPREEDHSRRVNERGKMRNGIYKSLAVVIREAWAEKMLDGNNGGVGKRDGGQGKE